MSIINHTTLWQDVRSNLNLSFLQYCTIHCCISPRSLVQSHSIGNSIVANIVLVSLGGDELDILKGWDGLLLTFLRAGIWPSLQYLTGYHCYIKFCKNDVSKTRWRTGQRRHWYSECVEQGWRDTVRTKHGSNMLIDVTNGQIKCHKLKGAKQLLPN